MQKLLLNSTVDAELNFITLNANILQYKQEINQQQEGLIAMIQSEMHFPYMNPFDILHEVSVYKISKQPTETELKQFIKNAITAFYNREAKPTEKLDKPANNIKAVVFYIAATALIATVVTILAIIF